MLANKLILAPMRNDLSDRRLGLYAMVFLATMGWGIMSPILADVQAEFRVSVLEIALANSVFGVARLVLDVPIGLVMDKVSSILIRFSGSGMLFLGSVLCALAIDFTDLLIGRTLHGVGAAIIQVTNMVWISRLSTDERRGRHLGIYQAILLAGASFSPVVAGLLADVASWRASFWFSAVMALLGFVPMLVGKRDWLSSIKPASVPTRSAEQPGRLPAGKTNTLCILIVANVVTFALFFSTSGLQNTQLPLFAASALGVEAGTIGLIIGVCTVLRFGMSLVGGELSDRYGRRVVLIPGLVLMGVGALMFNTVVGLSGFWLAMIVLSLGRFGNNVPATVLADHSPPTRWSVVMGVNRAVADLGFVLGPVAVGLSLDGLGYASTNSAWAVMMWSCALAVLVVVRESRQLEPILGRVPLFKGRIAKR